MVMVMVTMIMVVVVVVMVMVVMMMVITFDNSVSVFGVNVCAMAERPLGDCCCMILSLRTLHYTLHN